MRAGGGAERSGPAETIVISTSRAKVETGADWVVAVLQQIVDSTGCPISLDPLCFCYFLGF